MGRIRTLDWGIQEDGCRANKHVGVSIMKIGCLVLEEKVVKVFTKTAYKNQTMIGGATK